MEPDRADTETGFDTNAEKQRDLVRPSTQSPNPINSGNDNSGLSASSADVATRAGIPERIGKYRIVRLLGAGGCGVVYHAIDPKLKRDVAIKIPLPHNLVTPALRKRFLLEAVAAAKLDHPKIVAAFEAGEEDNTPFIAYAYCSGPTLSQWIRENGPLSIRAAVSMTADLAEAVQYSHDQGILHRDLKPANILLFPARNTVDHEWPFDPRISDFGLAAFPDSASTVAGSSVIVGTPVYMAPEQFRSSLGKAGSQVDVFGLGAILYESLTGKPPFAGENVINILDAIRAGRIARVRLLRPEIPRELATVCEKALAENPKDRYFSPGEFMQDLRRFLGGERTTAKPPSLWTRVIRMAESEGRIAEAAGYVILSHAAVLLWVISWPTRIVLQLGNTYGVPLEELLPYSIPLVFFHAFSIFLGWKIGQRVLWAARVSTILAGLMAAYILSIVLGFQSPPYPSIYSDVRSRDIVFSLLASLFVMQAILCLCAWGALTNSSQSGKRVVASEGEGSEK